MMRRRRKTNYNSDELYDKTQYADKELIDKISLWALRILFKLNGSKEFLDSDNRFDRDSLAYFLGVGEYIDMDRDAFKRNEVFAILKRDLSKLEKRKRFSTSKILAKNIKQLSSLMDLNTIEEQLVEFCVIVNQYDILRDAINLLGHELNTTQAKRALSVILNIPGKELDNSLKSHSKLMKSSIVSINKNNTRSLDSKIEIITESFADDMLNLNEDISVMIKEAVRPCSKSTLTLQDYEHITKDLDILVPYLSNAINTKQTGVNILFYGLPGTGKTELAKTISEILQTELFEISYADEDDEAIDGRFRLRAYKMAQALLANKDIILMYDEAEDIFESNSGFFAPKRQENKAWLNRILETNTIPTIWITNNIHSIDNAMVRRFDYAIEMPIPKKSKRAQIIKNYSDNLLDEQSIKLLAENENIAPALITRATKVVSSIDVEDRPKAFKQVLNNTLKAQGYAEIKEKCAESSLPSVYNPQFINTTTNLDNLAQGILKHQNARLCLYGPAGTGKSAYGKYIARILDKPLLLKKGSDLISMWVGGTEKNIANAFLEAKEEKAVLVFDEVDSFLADRSQAKQSWEVTQVNEMLVQMENFDGIFIATTNLMDNLDSASLRRFDLKLEFSYLKPEQAWKMFIAYSKELSLKKPSSSLQRIVQSMKYLTPGDFAAVTRQNRFRPITDAKDLLQRLEDEIAIKQVSGGSVMGFLAS